MSIKIYLDGIYTMTVTGNITVTFKPWFRKMIEAMCDNGHTVRVDCLYSSGRVYSTDIHVSRNTVDRNGNPGVFRGTYSIDTNGYVTHRSLTFDPLYASKGHYFYRIMKH